jgi:dTDP-L-rhamnose 4-epimerase
MSKKVLLIGGAGFIGSHTADALAVEGYQIRILDLLSPTTHQPHVWPDYLSSEYELIEGDARERDVLLKALQGVDYVFDFLGLMDLLPKFSQFIDVNVTSTALLYELIVENSLPVKQVVVASTQFVYGEGCWRCIEHGEVHPIQRSIAQLERKQWDPVCPVCNEGMDCLDNIEIHQDPSNQYSISKYAKELFALKVGALYSIPSTAMRYSIVLGSRQTLRNGYSGALRIFTSKLKHSLPLPIYEDGNQLRDFVAVADVARANVVVLNNSSAYYECFNVGGGKKYTLFDLIEVLSRKLDLTPRTEVTGEFRLGDIRHAVSDTTKLERLDWRPERNLEDCINDYLPWYESQADSLAVITEAEHYLRSHQIIRSKK